MTDIPWFGPPTGMTEPDPIIWWFIGPVIAYVWAFWAAAILSAVINSRPQYDDEEDESA